MFLTRSLIIYEVVLFCTASILNFGFCIPYLTYCLKLMFAVLAKINNIFKDKHSIKSVFLMLCEGDNTI